MRFRLSYGGYKEDLVKDDGLPAHTDDDVGDKCDALAVEGCVTRYSHASQGRNGRAERRNDTMRGHIELHTVRNSEVSDIDPPAAGPDSSSALVADFSETAHALFSAGSVQETLTQVVELSVATIEGCDYAGIFLFRDGAITTSAPTDPAVTAVDAIQQASGEGPCLDATTQGIAYYAGDLGTDPRWPHFGPAATAQGMRSLLALPLLGNGTLGALNLYAKYPDAFGVVDRAKGYLLAAVAGLAFSTALVHEDQERREANLQAALATREMIGQAQGILMERERITADQAFDVLRRASQHLNLKLRDVAQGLIETGERPDTGAPRTDEVVPPRNP